MLAVDLHTAVENNELALIDVGFKVEKKGDKYQITSIDNTYAEKILKMYKLKIGDKIGTTLLSQIYFEICSNIQFNPKDFLKKESSEKKFSPESESSEMKLSPE
jgi:hypothetical protein